MMQAILIETIDQGTQHMLLSNDFRKGFRSPLAGQNQITHQRYVALVQLGWRPTPAGPRRPSPKAPLLPSGPDGLTYISPRGDQCEPPLSALFYALMMEVSIISL